jgi:hypothetical protein
MAAAGAKGECPSADELARRFAAHDRECSEVLAQLARRGGLDPRRATRGDAAVLVLLVRDEAAGCVHVWLTKRAEALRTHSGEVSLPGGKAEAGDAGPEDTALRCARHARSLRVRWRLTRVRRDAERRARRSAWIARRRACWGGCCR